MKIQTRLAFKPAPLQKTAEKWKEYPHLRAEAKRYEKWSSHKKQFNSKSPCCFMREGDNCTCVVHPFDNGGGFITHDTYSSLTFDSASPFLYRKVYFWVPDISYAQFIPHLLCPKPMDDGASCNGK